MAFSFENAAEKYQNFERTKKMVIQKPTAINHFICIGISIVHVVVFILLAERPVEYDQDIEFQRIFLPNIFNMAGVTQHDKK